MEFCLKWKYIKDHSDFNITAPEACSMKLMRVLGFSYIQCVLVSSIAVFAYDENQNIRKEC
jgi:disulfide bond formation protein DsbB